MARKKMETEPENTERWLVTYADLISLLMIFFVVMFASSEVQKEKLLAISESLRRALRNDAVMAAAVGANLLSTPMAQRTTAVSEAIKEEAKAFGIDKGISFSTDERGVIITIAESIFFDAGEFEIKPRVRLLLKKIGDFLRETNIKAVVEGHTDNSEINKPPISSNWELSTLRATNVVRFLIKECHIDPRLLAATGYADTRPLVPNTTAENRARNRRIDLVLVNAEVKTKRFKSKSVTTLDLIERAKKTKEKELIQKSPVLKDGEKKK